jgi:hypothetical protein
MRTATLGQTIDRALVGGLVLAGLLLTGPLPRARATSDSSGLPRFSEEREAAALCFLKKHLPELLPVLEQLKKDDKPRYELEVRAVFQVSEMLAELQDDPRRQDLELRIWKTENKANLLVAQLATPEKAKRDELQEQIARLAAELVELDIQVLELKIEQLEEEASKVKVDLASAQTSKAELAKTRYDELIHKAKKHKK